jgi:DNA-binding NtrC family response regulator
MTAEGTQRPSVLLLEDDTPLADMILMTLADEFEIERAANAEEARMLLGARPFDILLCDHMMPGKQQGLEFLVEAMERHPKSRRILMTGYINPDMLSRSITVAGLSACIMKPFDMRQLRRQLHESIGMDS